MSKLWFTADFHLDHEEILKLANRPFPSISVMNQKIIENYNSRVKPDDFCIFLGDFMFLTKLHKPIDFTSQLNGHITYLKGNHDHNNSFDTKIEYLVVSFANKKVYCTHDPKDFSSSYTLNLVGHVHNAWKIKAIYNTTLLNMGVDAWNYVPVCIEEIEKAISEFQDKSHEEAGKVTKAPRQNLNPEL